MRLLPRTASKNKKRLSASHPVPVTRQWACRHRQKLSAHQPPPSNAANPTTAMPTLNGRCGPTFNNTTTRTKSTTPFAPPRTKRSKSALEGSVSRKRGRRPTAEGSGATCIRGGRAVGRGRGRGRGCRCGCRCLHRSLFHAVTRGFRVHLCSEHGPTVNPGARYASQVPPSSRSAAVVELRSHHLSWPDRCATRGPSADLS